MRTVASDLTLKDFAGAQLPQLLRVVWIPSSSLRPLLLHQSAQLTDRYHARPFLAQTWRGSSLVLARPGLDRSLGARQQTSRAPSREDSREKSATVAPLGQHIDCTNRASLGLQLC